MEIDKIDEALRPEDAPRYFEDPEVSRIHGATWLITRLGIIFQAP
jgi:hypothetical protein